ncbi:CBO0543 family protein [Bacillus sp. T33-2]|uniref:CBO0543 family protein n=1 Tax=Bacillus sp. T33-2 TaxID=2054168 RepID=UPI000C78332C|nr:CBO0543 family protein [Bacillus sp. T33-2]PLR95134.1 hypothetical protein CVD19_15915 [Bacillus sp. T33-2]
MGISHSQRMDEAGRFFEKIRQAEIDYANYWYENTLWEWDFWLSVSISLGSWIIWFIFRKRGSEGRLLLAGMFVLFIAYVLDFIGVIMGFWIYTGKVIPIIPADIPWDASLIPVTVMLWLQYKPGWNPMLKAVIYSALTSFVGEPLFEWLGLYYSKNWIPFYSFPIYIMIYLLAHRISRSKSFDPI